MRTAELVAENGGARLVDSAIGELGPGRVRVRTLYSGISAGTELGILKASAGSPGPRGLGYQVAGRVEAVAPELAAEFTEGDTVACYGGPYVHHASVLDVPRRLAGRLPAGVEPLHASLVGLGVIGLHAFRTGRLALGETCAVVGLGSLGNLTAQLARAAGCRVAALDLIETRRAAARECGLTVAADPGVLKEQVAELTGGNGADAVFLVVGGCSDELLAAAVDMVCFGGRVVLVGTGTPQLPREAMFLKEAQIVVSRAGGPGRYDPAYEAEGHDYPYGLVRWTEQRSIGEVLRLMATGAVNAAPLVSDVLAPAEAAKAYDMLREDPADHIGIVFDWSR